MEAVETAPAALRKEVADFVSFVNLAVKVLEHKSEDPGEGEDE